MDSMSRFVSLHWIAGVVRLLAVYLLAVGCAAPAEPVKVEQVRWGDNFWLHYGSDVGSEKLGLRWSREALRAEFKKRVQLGMEGTRVWLFADGRSGLEERNGHIFLSASVNEDLDALFEAARATGLKLYPVLVDHIMWNGKAVEVDGGPLGEHTDWLRDAKLRGELVRALGTAVRSYQKRFPDVVPWWDLANEPCHGAALTEHAQDFRHLCAFLEELALEVLRVPKTRFSIGFRDRATLERWAPRLHRIRQQYERTGARDFRSRCVLQFHFYRKHESNESTKLEGFHVRRLLDRMGLGAVEVALGEMDPAPPAEGEPRLSPADLRDMGFSYVFYWKDPSRNFAPVPNIRVPQRRQEFWVAGPQDASPKRANRLGERHKQNLGGELQLVERTGSWRRVKGTVPGGGVKALHSLEKIDTPNIEGKLVVVEVHLKTLPEHGPGWYGHLLLTDDLGQAWIGPGEFLPTRRNKWVRLWSAPVVKRPYEVYPDDEHVDLKRIARIGLWLVPGHPTPQYQKPGEPAREPLDVEIAIRSARVFDRWHIPRAARHALDILDDSDGVAPAERFSLLQPNARWAAEDYTDSQAVTQPRLENGQLKADVSFQCPDKHKTKGEVQLEVESLNIPVLDTAAAKKITEGVLLNLLGTLVRFHVTCEGKNGVLPHYFTVAICDPAYRRVDMPGEVKLMPGRSGWVQFWLPTDTARDPDLEIAKRASIIRLKAALDAPEGTWDGCLTVDKAEVVPVKGDLLEGGNLLKKEFCSLLCETWASADEKNPQGDRGISNVNIQNGTATFNLDIGPDLKWKTAGSLVYDVRQNSPHLGINCSRARIRLELDWRDAGDAGYFIQLGLMDRSGSFGSLPIARMAPRRQTLTFTFPHAGLETPIGENAVNLEEITKLIIKVGPRQGCRRNLKGTFAIHGLTIEPNGAAGQ